MSQKGVGPRRRPDQGIPKVLESFGPPSKRRQKESSRRLTKRRHNVWELSRRPG